MLLDRRAVVAVAVRERLFFNRLEAGIAKHRSILLRAVVTPVHFDAEEIFGVRRFVRQQRLARLGPRGSRRLRQDAVGTVLRQLGSSLATAEINALIVCRW